MSDLPSDISTEQEIRLLSKALAERLEEEIKLSKKQAQVLFLRELGGLTNSEVADEIGVASGSSASTYVTRCREKFRDADDEIQRLDREIERWGNTKKIEDLVEKYESNPSIESLRNFSDEVEDEFEEPQKFLVWYVRDGKQAVDILEGTHPTNSPRDIIEYKRIDDIGEIFS
jgi:hypothetical protein